jgi:hypothetical protein
MAEPYRVAVYYAPAADDPLWALGCAWLGRDAATGLAVAQPGYDGLAAQTAAPRRYGFHATLKPPMRLRGTLRKFKADAARLARGIAPFDLPPLEVMRLGRFLALGLTGRPGPLHELADACVVALDPHRQAETADEVARRAAGRTASELENLRRYGYPHVLADWRFHMTLTGPAANDTLAAQAREFFGDALRAPRRVDAICLFAEAEPGGDFMVLERLPLGG